jgi:hypothetical protein
MQLPPKRRFGREWLAAANGAAVYGGFLPLTEQRVQRGDPKKVAPGEVADRRGAGCCLLKNLLK